MTSWLALLLLACGSGGGDRSFELTGEVVEIRSETELVIAHDDIDGFMDAMTMPFTVSDVRVLSGVHAGDKVEGTLVVGETTRLTALEVTERAPPRTKAKPAPPPRETQPVAEGEVFPGTPVILAVGDPITIGEGQRGRIAVTYVYTRCPLPEYCPLVARRLQELQAELPDGARLLAITMDPDYDSRGVLRDYGESVGAEPGKWDFGRVPKEILLGLAERSGLAVRGRGTDIVHDLVLLVLDEDGRLVKRYDHMEWETAEVLALLEG
jgi:protein SCO1/2